MFARPDRLHPRSRVSDTLRNGRRARVGSVCVHHVPGPDGPHVSVVLAKGAGNSVQRHRRQRRVRHAARALWNDIPPGQSVIRVLRDADWEATVADLRKALGRL